MAGEPYPSRGCCAPRAVGVTQLRVGPNQDVVGMVGLQAVFEQLRALGCSPEELSDAELVGMARKSNYIPNTERVEAEYTQALRQAYTEWFHGK